MSLLLFGAFILTGLGLGAVVLVLLRHARRTRKTTRRQFIGGALLFLAAVWFPLWVLPEWTRESLGISVWTNGILWAAISTALAAAGAAVLQWRRA